MSKPIRIRRTTWKNWECPEGAVYVGRPTKYGNPYRVDELGRAGAIAAFKVMLKDKRMRIHLGYPSDVVIKRELKGKHLVCWCRLNEECHADILLKIAN